jgi:ParB-like chromosome segregation protein Spo0J
MPIDRIRATAHRRARDISDLVQSIREVGLLQPLVVDSEGNLLAGYHRYLAVRELGWEEVPVAVVELDALRAELATLDENIVRHELTELERAEMEARRREIYEILYPLTKRGVVSNVRRSAQPRLTEVESDDVDQRETISLRYESGTLNPEGETAPTYIQYAAERQGVTDRTIKNRLRIAEKLHPEVRDYIRGTPLADDQRGLLRLTRLEDPEMQLAAAQLIVEHGVPPRLAVERAQRMAVQVDTPTLEGQDPLLPPEIVYVRGDFRDGLAQLPDGSVQLILTDPPYAEEALPLYEELARHAARVLEEGGSLICYVGQHLLPRAAQAMSEHLRYWWTLAVVHASPTQTIYGKNVWVRWKPALWFVRGGRATSDIVADVIHGTPPDKTPHPWAQGVDEVRPLIRALTTPGGLVVDPMAGSGAFLWATYLEGRRALGFEVDDERYAAGRGWLMERYAAHVGREEVQHAH